jgi:hypothetical protein
MPRNVSGPSIQYFCISDHHQQVEGIRALLFVLDWVIRIAEMQITKLVSDKVQVGKGDLGYC